MDPTRATSKEPAPSWLGESFDGMCWVCGAHERFVGEGGPIGSTFRCPSCRAVLRYQPQALALVRRFSKHGARCFAELMQEREFRALRIYEPGELGSFRRYLRELPGYETSNYRPDEPSGAIRDGMRNQDLMALTYPSHSFDLVLTTDMFEHVRRPYEGFAEFYRVLRPGGAHVFTVPVRWPLRKRTVARVDTSGEQDVHLLEPRYHGPGRCLVYNDFGRDMLDRLDEIGFDTEVVRFPSTNQSVAKKLAFCSIKSSDGSLRTRAVVGARRLAARLRRR